MMKLFYFRKVHTYQKSAPAKNKKSVHSSRYLVLKIRPFKAKVL